MRKKKEYDIKAVKKMILKTLSQAYYELAKINQNTNQNTKLEEDLMAYAMYKVLEDDVNTKEQFLEFMGLSYMVKGIIEKFHLIDNMCPRLPS